MRTEDRSKNLKTNLKILYGENDNGDKASEEYTKSLGFEAELKLYKYLRRTRYEIPDSICKTNILRINGDIIDKEKQLINAVQAYLKLEYCESYQKNNLEEAFIRAKTDENTRAEIIEIIDRFIFE